jgi:hypothetical protein
MQLLVVEHDLLVNQIEQAELSLELTKRFDLDVSFVWDRISNPKVGADGVEPKPDDFRLVVGLGVDF